MAANRKRALRLFAQASDYAVESGFGAEIERQRRVSLHEFTESDLLREAAWVILCSGFREATVRRYFDHISLCFCDWESAAVIVQASAMCKATARYVFRHESKLDAIIGVAKSVVGTGFVAFKTSILANPIEELQRLPYIGPTTVWHLAKNIGLDVAKPDRHLARVSSKLGFSDAMSLCATIARAAGEQINVVDLVIWRFFANNPKARKQWY